MADTEAIFLRKVKRIIAPASTEKEFSLVSYNILCDAVFESGSAIYPYLTEDLKLRGPQPAVAPRHIQLIRELTYLDADIVCLQEVDPFYFPYLVEELGMLGYDGVYKKHDSEHGLATFYKKSKFEMRNSNAPAFTALIDELSAEDGQLKERNRHNERVAQYTTLQDVHSGNNIVVVNVHIIFNCFRDPDVHALQIALFFQHLHKILPQSEKHSSPWVVCGDFNTRPHFPVYEMMRNGKMTVECVDKLNPAKWKYPELTKQSEIVNYDSIVLRKHKKNLHHPFKDSRSAYKTVLGTEPALTHYECSEVFKTVFGTEFMKGPLDYIWYSSDSLQVNAVLETVNEDVIAPHHACPNKIFPSDHLSLKAFFQFPTKTV